MPLTRPHRRHRRPTPGAPFGPNNPPHSLTPTSPNPVGVRGSGTTERGVAGPYNLRSRFSLSIKIKTFHTGLAGGWGRGWGRGGTPDTVEVGGTCRSKDSGRNKCLEDLCRESALRPLGWSIAKKEVTQTSLRSELGGQRFPWRGFESGGRRRREGGKEDVVEGEISDVEGVGSVGMSR